MLDGRATPEYSQDASEAAKLADSKLSREAKRCIELAAEAARERNDNHVGTEHLVLGLIGGAPDVESALSRVGITRTIFEAQLFDEPGVSPHGSIPLTPRALRILGFALEEASGLRSPTIEPLHLLLGVMDESEYWRSLRTDGPHHLAQAATAAGVTLRDVRNAALAAISPP